MTYWCAYGIPAVANKKKYQEKYFPNVRDLNRSLCPVSNNNEKLLLALLFKGHLPHFRHHAKRETDGYYMYVCLSYTHTHMHIYILHIYVCTGI